MPEAQQVTCDCGSPIFNVTEDERVLCYNCKRPWASGFTRSAWRGKGPSKAEEKVNLWNAIKRINR